MLVAGVVGVEVVGVDVVGVIVVGVEVVGVDVAGVTGWTGALRVVPVFGVVTFGRVEGLVVVAAGGVVGVDVVGAGVEVVGAGGAVEGTLATGAGGGAGELPPLFSAA